jgi:hypothetical protein
MGLIGRIVSIRPLCSIPLLTGQRHVHTFLLVEHRKLNGDYFVSGTAQAVR